MEENNIYKEMYFKLLAANKDIAENIKKAEQECEELYISAEEN